MLWIFSMDYSGYFVNYRKNQQPGEGARPILFWIGQREFFLLIPKQVNGICGGRFYSLVADGCKCSNQN